MSSETPAAPPAPTTVAPAALPSYTEYEPSTPDSLQKIQAYDNHLRRELYRRGEYTPEVEQDIVAQGSDQALRAGYIADPAEYAPPMAADQSPEFYASELIRSGQGTERASKIYKAQALRKEGAPQDIIDMADRDAALEPVEKEALVRSAVRSGRLPFAVLPKQQEDGTTSYEFAVNPELGHLDREKILELGNNIDPRFLPSLELQLTRVPGLNYTPAQARQSQEFDGFLDDQFKTDPYLGEQFSRAVEDYNRVGKVDTAPLERSLEALDTTGDFSREARRRMIADRIRRAAKPEAYDPEKPENHVQYLESGEVWLPEQTVFDKGTYEALTEKLPITPEQKEITKRMREGRLQAMAPAYVNAMGASPDALSFYEKSKKEGKSDTQIAEEWYGNPENYSGFLNRARASGMAFSEATKGLVESIGALAGSKGAIENLQERQGDMARNEEYARLFGDSYGVGQTLINTAPQIITDMLVAGAVSAVASPVAGAGIAGARSIARQAITSATRDVVGGFIRAGEGSALRSIASMGDDVVGSLARQIGTTSGTAVSAYVRSAGSAYVSTYSALESQKNPDGSQKYSDEEKRRIALGTSAVSGLSTAAITLGFNKYLGGSAVEDFAAGRIGTAALRKMGMSDAAIAEATKSSASAILKGAYGEAAEEFTDQIVGEMIQSIGSGEDFKLGPALKNALEAGLVGGVFGGGAAAFEQRAEATASRQVQELLTAGAPESAAAMEQVEAAFNPAAPRSSTTAPGQRMREQVARGREQKLANEAKIAEAKAKLQEEKGKPEPSETKANKIKKEIADLTAENTRLDFAIENPVPEGSALMPGADVLPTETNESQDIDTTASDVEGVVDEGAAPDAVRADDVRIDDTAEGLPATTGEVGSGPDLQQAPVDQGPVRDTPAGDVVPDAGGGASAAPRGGQPTTEPVAAGAVGAAVEQPLKDAPAKTPRKVFIQQVSHAPNSWFVSFVDRKKHSKHDAAQFDSRKTSRAEVEEWVRNNPDLELVGDPSQEASEIPVEESSTTAPESGSSPLVHVGTEEEVMARDPGVVFAISRGDGGSRYTLWYKTRAPKEKGKSRGSWSYIRTLPSDKGIAIEVATKVATDLATKDASVKFAFTKSKSAIPDEENISRGVAVINDELSARDLNANAPEDLESIGNMTLGLGKYGNVPIKDLFAKDPGYTMWAYGSMNAAVANKMRTYLESQPEFLAARDAEEAQKQEMEEAAAAFEAKQAEKKTPFKKPTAPSRAPLTEDNVVENPVVEKQAVRRAAEQVQTLVEKPGADSSIIPEHLRSKMFPMQASGAAAAINALDSNGAFLNGDGAGVGKTRQILAVANHYASQGKPVIIITENAAIGKPWEGRKKPILGGSMAKDGEAMGVKVELMPDTPEANPEGRIFISTYPRIKSEQVPKDAVIIFDESQSLANVYGDISKESGNWKDKFQEIFSREPKVAFFSATPADKPHQLAYLYKALGFSSPEAYLQEALKHGMLKKVRKFGRDEIPYYDVPRSQGAKTKLYNWVNGLMLKAGADGNFIKREISYEGTDVQFHDVKGTDPDINPWAQHYLDAENVMMGAEASGYRLLAPRSYTLYAAELAKIGEAIKFLKRELSSGRKAVIYFSRIKDMEIRGRRPTMSRDGEYDPGEVEVLGIIPSPVKLLREELAKEGITFAELHGSSGDTSKTAQDKFSKDVNVLLASVESGGTGINLDDTKGDTPRTEIFMFAPYRGISTIQAMGRIWRASTIQNDDAPNRYAMIVASDIPADAQRSAVLAKKLQLMSASLGGTAVAKLPMSKVSYDPEQLVGLEIPEEGEGSNVEYADLSTEPLPPVDIRWTLSRSGTTYWAKATPSLMKWLAVDGPERTGVGVRVKKTDDGRGYIAFADADYKPEDFTPVEDTPEAAPAAVSDKPAEVAADTAEAPLPAVLPSVVPSLNTFRQDLKSQGVTLSPAESAARHKALQEQVRAVYPLTPLPATQSYKSAKALGMGDIKKDGSLVQIPVNNDGLTAPFTNDPFITALQLSAGLSIPVLPRDTLNLNPAIKLNTAGTNVASSVDNQGRVITGKGEYNRPATAAREYQAQAEKEGFRSAVATLPVADFSVLPAPVTFHGFTIDPLKTTESDVLRHFSSTREDMEGVDAQIRRLAPDLDAAQRAAIFNAAQMRFLRELREFTLRDSAGLDYKGLGYKDKRAYDDYRALRKAMVWNKSGAPAGLATFIEHEVQNAVKGIERRQTKIVSPSGSPDVTPEEALERAASRNDYNSDTEDLVALFDDFTPEALMGAAILTGGEPSDANLQALVARLTSDKALRSKYNRLAVEASGIKDIAKRAAYSQKIRDMDPIELATLTAQAVFTKPELVQAKPAPVSTPQDRAVSVVESVLTPEEKVEAAAELGAPEWSPVVAETFTKRMTDWVVGTFKASAKLAALFKKVIDKGTALLVGAAVLFSITPANSPGASIINPRDVVAPAPDISGLLGRLAAPAEGSDQQSVRFLASFDEGGLTGVAAAQPTDAPTINPEYSTPEPDFRGRDVSKATRKMAAWIVEKGDNKGLPFVIADKQAGTAVFFDGDGVLSRKSPALFGKTPGDTLSKAELAMPLVKARTTPSANKTPAGRFESTFDPDDASYGATINFLSEGNSVLAIHRVYTGRPAEDRVGRLASESPLDNRVSLGCINVPADVAASEIGEFEDGGVVYVLPETEAGKAAFTGFKDALQSPSLSMYTDQEIEENKQANEKEAKDLKLDGDLTPAAISEALAHIARSSRYPRRYRAIAQALAKFDQHPKIFLVDMPASAFAGTYSPSTHSIVLNMAATNGRGLIDAFSHEMIHAVTIEAVQNPRTKAARDLRDKLERYRQTLAEQLGPDQAYAVSSLDEFITHALTDPRFQRQAREVLDKGRTLWAKIVDAIARFLGISNKDFVDETLSFVEHAATYGYRGWRGDGAKLGSMAGRAANLSQFMRDSLETAEAMSASGKSSAEIRAVTGWFPGKYDGKMRWEIPDNEAALNTREFLELDDRAPTKLGDLLSHDALFAAYPELADVDVTSQSDFDAAGGGFQPSSGAIDLGRNGGDQQKTLSTLLHEIQHWIQREEGFARGGNVFSLGSADPEQRRAFLQRFAEKELERAASLESKYRKVHEGTISRVGGLSDADRAFLDSQADNRTESEEDLYDRYGDTWGDIDYAGSASKAIQESKESLEFFETLRSLADKLRNNPTEENADTLDRLLRDRGFSASYQVAYRDVAGEIESRDVEARRTMTPEQRAAAEPYSSRNVAPEAAIVLFGSPATVENTPSFQEYLPQLPEGLTYEFNTSPSEDYASVDLARPGVVTIYSREIEDLIDGIDPANARSLVRRIVNHEVAHVAGFNTLTSEDIQAIASTLTGSDILNIARRYYGPSSPASRVVEDLQNGTLTEAQVVQEWLRMQLEQVVQGGTTEEALAFHSKNPGVIQRVLRYMKEAISKLWHSIRGPEDHATKVSLARMIREYRRISSGSAYASAVPFDPADPERDNRILGARKMFDDSEPDVDEVVRSMYEPSIQDMESPYSPGKIMDRLFGARSGDRRHENEHVRRLQSNKTIEDIVLKRKTKLIKAIEKEGANLDLVNAASGDRGPNITAAQDQRIKEEYDAMIATIEEEYNKAIDEASSREEMDKAAEDQALAVKEAISEKKRMEEQAIQVTNSEKRRKRDAAMEQLEKEAPETAELVAKFRKTIDTASEAIAGFQDPESRLHFVITESLESYLTQGYRLHHSDVSPIDRVRDPANKEIVERAAEFMLRGHIENEADRMIEEAAEEGRILGRKEAEAAARAMAEKDNLFETVVEDYVLSHGQKAFYHGGDSFKADLTRFMRQQDVPQELKDLLGDIDDPVENLVRTNLNVGMLAASIRFTEDLAKLGLTSGSMVTEAQQKGFRKMIQGSDEDYMKGALRLRLGSFAHKKGWVPTGELETEDGAATVFVPPWVHTAREQRDITYLDDFEKVGSDSKKYGTGKLSDLYAHPQVAGWLKTFSKSKPPTTDSEKMVHQMGLIFAAATGASLATATLGSVGFFVRNLVSTFFWLIANGINPFSKDARDAVALAWKALKHEESGWISKLTALGVMNNDLRPSTIKEMLAGDADRPDGLNLFETIGKAIGKAKGLKAGTKVGEAVGKLTDAASAIDSIAKVAGFFHELKAIRKAHPDWSPEQQEQAAADKVSQTYQARSRTAPIVEDIGKSSFGKLFIPFMRFKTDMIRLVHNIPQLASQEMKSDNPEIRARGRQRMAGFAATMAFGIAGPALLSAMGGVGDDEERALRAALPPYLRGNSLFYSRSKDGKQITSSDFTFINPYSAPADLVSRFGRGLLKGDPDEAAKEMATWLGSQFLEDQILAGAIHEVMNNRTADNKPITFDTDGAVDKTRKYLAHLLGSAYTPGLAKTLYRSGQAAKRGVPEDAAFFDTPVGILAAHAAPVRPRTFQTEDLALRAFRDAFATNRDVRALAGQLKRRQNLDADDIAGIVEDLYDSSQDLNSHIGDLVRGYEGLGLPKHRIAHQMKESGFSRERAKTTVFAGKAASPTLTEATRRDVSEAGRAAGAKEDRGALALRIMRTLPRMQSTD